MIQKVPARLEDDLFLFQLYAETRSAEMQALGWDDAMQQSFLHMQWKAQSQSYALQYPDAEHSILNFRNLPIGRVIVDRSRSETRLVDLTLLAASRNQGIGTGILQELLEEATKANQPLRLSVLKTNPAQTLYTRLGFVKTGENELYNFMEWSQPVSGYAFP
ncbi:hypothetical protein CBW65_06325 [Tumebacillus avium]|uniref:N-acetyltransferase domain-containing protein n=1 Tax=Tumebacillus avium TaxID=1903704 RepID=A0A1Y0ILP0_9BACL|nr:GNAT family N-acetyltransferase [Tumebacillus avium]ARU60746.1 hypothetical protein CBW65_06325 [Tumebacillus avium]